METLQPLKEKVPDEAWFEIVSMREFGLLPHDLVRNFLDVMEARGWRMVPTLPTEDMIYSGMFSTEGRGDFARSCWRDMLDSAPRLSISYPTNEEGEASGGSWS